MISDFLKQLLSALKESWPAVGGGFIAAAVCYARMLQDADKKGWRGIAEGFLCGLLAFAASTILELVGLPKDADVFVGAIIGFLGVDALRDAALIFLDKKTGKKRGEDE